MGRLIPSEYLVTATDTLNSYSNKFTDSVAGLFGEAKDELCGKKGLMCFNKNRLIISVVILIIIALILCAVAAFLAYRMGKKYVDTTSEQIYIEDVEPYVDNMGRGINYY